MLSVRGRRLCDHSGGSGYVRGERPPVASIGWVGVWVGRRTGRSRGLGKEVGEEGV